MRLNKLLLLICISLFQFGSFAQLQQLNLTPNQIESYVVEIYGESFPTQNPTLVQAFKILLNDRIEFRFETQTPNEKYPVLSSLGINNKNNLSIPQFTTEAFDFSTFNPLRYGFDFFSNRTQIIRVDGTDWLMVINPQ